MRFMFITFILSVFIIFSCGEKEAAKEQTVAKMDHMPDTTSEKLIYYTCPMPEHKEMHSAEPGKCSKCDMDLVKGVVTTEDKKEFYGCPMLAHSHVRQDSAGTCADCSMELKPMRLVKYDH